MVCFDDTQIDYLFTAEILLMLTQRINQLMTNLQFRLVVRVCNLGVEKELESWVVFHLRKE